MVYKLLSLLIFILLLGLISFSLSADSSYLYGIHWYGNTGSSDVEAMSGNRGIWDLEITHVDTTQAQPWDVPGYYASSVCPIVTGIGKNHSVIFRIHPYWGRSVPNSADPYTLTNYTTDIRAAANTLKNYCHIWQIGNEVNINGENNKWGGSSYDLPWEPTPAEYSTTYLACRDAIHTVTPLTSPSTQIVLMQPNSPGNVIGGTRFMDGNEFLWRMIEAIPDKSKIDGFALHGYAEPGGTNYGVDGFWDSIREQLMIIDQWGLGNRPVYITEFNKHMPNSTEANIGAKFLSRAYSFMYSWNTGSDGEWLGLPNHNVVEANWFVYPSGLGWDEYSLQYWKSNIASTNPELNPWYSFNSIANFTYSKGSNGGGPSVSSTTLWWQDDFNGGTLDSTPPLPDWKAEVTGSGSVTMSGTGQVRLLGNSSLDGGGGIRTAGYVYGNFHLEMDMTFTNANRSNTGDSECNFDVRIREGSKGYSLTLFPSNSLVNTNNIILRRTNDWTQIGSFNQNISGGINTGDTFHITIIANDSNLTYQVFKNGSSTPVVNWNVTDSGQKVGWIRLMTWNLNEARIDKVQLGGPDWSPTVSVYNWESLH